MSVVRWSQLQASLDPLPDPVLIASCSAAYTPMITATVWPKFSNPDKSPKSVDSTPLGHSRDINRVIGMYASM